MKIPRILFHPATLVGLLTCLAFASRLAGMLQSPHPHGADGYYYVTQLTRMFLEGHFHTPESSWVLYLMAACRTVCGDSILAVKLVSAGLAAVCVPAAWYAGRSIGNGQNRNPAWILALWAAASPTLSLLAADHPKNIGVVPAALVLLGLVLSRHRTRLTFLLMGISALATMTAHRLGAALVALAAAGMFAGWLLGPRKDSAGGRRRLMACLLAATTLLVFVLLTWLLPNLLHPSDLERLKGQFDFTSGWPPPMAYFALRDLHPVQQVELVLTWACFALGLAAFVSAGGRRPLVAALLLVLFVCNFPFWNREVLDLGYRTSLMSPVVAVVLLTVSWPERLRFFGRALVPAMLICACLSFLVARTGLHPHLHPPFDRYAQIIDRIPRPLPGRLIAHRGFNFFYGHVTLHMSVAWAPEPELERKAIFRLAWGISDGEWLELAPGQAGVPGPLRLDPSYTYVREDVWETFVANAQKTGDEDLLERCGHWKNPQRRRPAYLQRNWQREKLTSAKGDP